MSLLQSNTKTHKILKTVVKQTSEKPARAATLRNKQINMNFGGKGTKTNKKE